MDQTDQPALMDHTDQVDLTDQVALMDREDQVFIMLFTVLIL